MRRFTKTTRLEMPIYEYRCENCGHEFDTLQKVSDDALTDCPECAKPALVKKVSAAGFRLKGGGWYETDFKSGKKKNVAGSDSSSSGSSSSSSDSSSSSGSSSDSSSGSSSS
jgi:putative FmdB family regulatory protein